MSTIFEKYKIYVEIAVLLAIVGLAVMITHNYTAAVAGRKLVQDQLASVQANDAQQMAIMSQAAKEQQQFQKDMLTHLAAINQSIQDSTDHDALLAQSLSSYTRAFATEKSSDKALSAWAGAPVPAFVRDGLRKPVGQAPASASSSP